MSRCPSPSQRSLNIKQGRPHGRDVAAGQRKLSEFLHLIDEEVAREATIQPFVLTASKGDTRFSKVGAKPGAAIPFSTQPFSGLLPLT